MDSPRLVGALLGGGVWTSAALLAAGLVLGEGWLRAGLLVLLATPALRVAALLAAWLSERRWGFAAVAATVLLLLGLALRI